MAKFLVLYEASVSAREQMAQATPEQARAGMDAWMAWAARAGTSLVELGAPLGDEERIPGGAPSGGSEQTAGFSILEADSMQGALDLLHDHPHLHTPGESSIRVLEFLQLPGA